MTTKNLIASWTPQNTRQGDLAGHPAGEIRLGTGGGLARRSTLLSTAGDLDSPLGTSNTWGTFTTPF